MSKTNEYMQGVISMCRSSKAAVKAIKEGKVSAEAIEKWLDRIIEVDLKFLKENDSRSK